MTLDVRMRDLALRLLEKFGKGAEFVRVTPGAYNAATGVIAAAEANTGIKLYLDQPNREELASGQAVVNSEVAIFAAKPLAFDPTVNDRLLVDGRRRTITFVNRVWSGEQVALWRCGVDS